MKTIVIDARTIDGSTGHYTQSLLYYINKDYSNLYRFIVLVPSQTHEHWKSLYDNLTVEIADEKSYSVGEQTSFVARLESYSPDLVHFTMPQQPFLWIKPSVTTVFDLTLVHYNNVDMNRYIYRFKKGVFVSLLRTVITRSKAIITSTQHTKDDITSYMGERFRSKIYVAHAAGEIINTKPEAIQQLKNDDFLLFVGNAFPYKNIQCIIDAFAILKTSFPNLKLALAGKKDFFYKQLEEYAQKNNIDGIYFLGYISDSEKRWALQNCKAYVTASLSEGFNMPILEAMIEGSPLIVSDATCHREVAGEAGLFFDPYSPKDLADTIDHLLIDQDLRNELIKQGKAHAATFSWEDTARKIIDVYKSVIDK